MRLSTQRKFLIALAAFYCAFGFKLALNCIFLAWNSDLEPLGIVWLVLGTLLGGLALGAGVEVLRERSNGLTLLTVVTALQIPVVLRPSIGFRLTLGPYWHWLVGFEGDAVTAKADFDVAALLSFAQQLEGGGMLIGVNVLALAATVVLVRMSQNAASLEVAV